MILFYDNGGETADRYTVLIQTDKPQGFDVYGFSEDANSPQGFNQYCGHFEHNEQPDSDKITFDELPLMVKREVIRRLS